MEPAAALRVVPHRQTVPWWQTGQRVVVLCPATPFSPTIPRPPWCPPPWSPPACTSCGVAPSWFPPFPPPCMRTAPPMPSNGNTTSLHASTADVSDSGTSPTPAPRSDSSTARVNEALSPQGTAKGYGAMNGCSVGLASGEAYSGMLRKLRPFCLALLERSRIMSSQVDPEENKNCTWRWNGLRGSSWLSYSNVAHSAVRSSGGVMASGESGLNTSFHLTRGIVVRFFTIRRGGGRGRRGGRCNMPPPPGRTSAAVCPSAVSPPPFPSPLLSVSSFSSAGGSRFTIATSKRVEPSPPPPRGGGPVGKKRLRRTSKNFWYAAIVSSQSFVHSPELPTATPPPPCPPSRPASCPLSTPAPSLSPSLPPSPPARRFRRSSVFTPPLSAAPPRSPDKSTDVTDDSTDVTADDTARLAPPGSFAPIPKDPRDPEAEGVPPLFASPEEAMPLFPPLPTTPLPAPTAFAAAVVSDPGRARQAPPRMTKERRR